MNERGVGSANEVIVNIHFIADIMVEREISR
jgi:hypothetical protein